MFAASYGPKISEQATDGEINVAVIEMMLCAGIVVSRMLIGHQCALYIMAPIKMKYSRRCVADEPFMRRGNRAHACHER